MALDDIISVSIEIADASPKAVDFKTPLLMAKAPFVGYRLYSLTPAGLSAMVTDGFASWSRAYEIASTMKTQQGGTGRLYVYSRTTNQTQTLRLIPDITKTSVGSVIAFDITFGGVTSSISYTVVTNTVDAIIDGLEPLIDGSLAAAAGTAGITTTPSGGVATHLDLISDTAGEFIKLDGFGEEIMLQDVSADGSLAAQLTAAQAALGTNFYGLLIDGYSEAENNLARAFADANEKLFMAVSADDAIVSDTSSPTDVATDFMASNRSGVYFTRRMSGNQHAAHMAKMLGKVPGSETWAHKTLDGVTADVLSDTHFANLLAKRGLSYTSKLGISLTDSGRAGSGRPFDITHGADNQKAQIQTAVLLVFANNGKVPFNNRGRNMIKGAIEGVLFADERAGFIEPGWFVTVPEMSEISAADKTARRLNNVTYSAVLTGAIESAEVAGTLSTTLS
jgi:hypothetical protein